jgi:dihydroxyacetone kinase-like predicted kinase
MNFHALGPEVELEQARLRMEQDSTTVQTGEVTTASRTVELDGVAVQEGQLIGLHNGKLVATDGDLTGVTLALLEKMGAAHLSVSALYFGQEVTPEEAAALAERVQAEFPSLELVDVKPGGQPHYHYIISLE